MPSLRTPIAIGVVLAFAAGTTLFVAPPAAAARTTFTNPTAIAIPGLPSGGGNPYPSSISVSGMHGAITGVTVRLDGFSHTNPDDVDILLVAPSGQRVMVMSDACGSEDVVNATWTFGEGPPILPVVPGPLPDSSPPACDLFTYRPTDWQGSENLVSPAPPRPYGSNFADFNGKNPNGVWQLFVQDDIGGDVGQIARGWALTIDTETADAAVPGAGTSGVANPYPMTRTVAEGDTLITDLNVVLDGIFHQNPDDLDVLLVGPTGRSIVLMSDACGAFDVNAYGWVWDDEALDPMPDGGTGNDCGTRTWRPRDHEPGDVWPAPAPLPPHASSLAAFDLTSPNGEWRLFVRDDATGNVGFFTNRFQLQMQLRPKANTEFTTDFVTISEGAAGTITLRRAGAAPLGPATVAVTTLAASATSGLDYTPISTQVTFAAGQTDATVPIDALADTADEGEETYHVLLGSPSGDARLAGISGLTVVIPDTSPPQTTINRGPKGKTRSRKARLRFSSSEPGSTFECRLDNRDWKACTSPRVLKGLKPGKHRFRVRATDASENVDATPALRRWKVTRRR